MINKCSITSPAFPTAKNMCSRFCRPAYLSFSPAQSKQAAPTMTLPRWFDPRTMAPSPTTVPDEDEEVDEVSIANRGSCNACPVKQMLENTSNKFAASVQVSGFAPAAAFAAPPAANANVMGPPAPVVRPTTPGPTKRARKVQQQQVQQSAESASRSGRDSIANLLGAGETTDAFFRASFGGRSKFLDTAMEVILEAYSRQPRQKMAGICMR